MKPSSDILYFLLIALYVSCELPKKEKITSQLAKDSTKTISTEAIVDQVDLPCYKFLDNGKIKPVKLNKAYKGKIFLTAQYDSLDRTFKNHKIQVGLLTYKQSGKEYLTYRSAEGRTVPAELATLLPKLTKHLEYMQLEKTNYEGCIIPTSWGFSVIIE